MTFRPYPLPLSVDAMTVSGHYLTFEVCGLSLRLCMPGELRARLEEAVGTLRAGRRIQPVVVDLVRDGLLMSVPVQHSFFLRRTTVEQIRRHQEQAYARAGEEEMAHAV